MLNELLAMLQDVPPALAGAWAGWLLAGLGLSVWYRRAKVAMEAEQAAARAMARTRSGPRPAARHTGPRAEPVFSAASTDSAPAPRPQPAPPAPPAAVQGDPFADLASIFEEPAPAQAAYRVPGDSPILNSAGSPILKH